MKAMLESILRRAQSPAPRKCRPSPQMTYRPNAPPESRIGRTSQLDANASSAGRLREHHCRNDCRHGDADWVYWVQMARRVLAFALTFVVFGLPLASDLCAAVCEETASHHHHSADT